MDVGERIRKARERRRMTQRALAAALSVDRKTVDNWENGRTYPRSAIGALEEVLGISLEPIDQDTEVDERPEPTTIEELLDQLQHIQELLREKTREEPPEDRRKGA